MSACGGAATPGKQIGTVLATSEGTSAATGTWAYYFTDALGSTRSLWDQDGDRIGKYEYTPFGGKYADSGNDVTRKYTGHDWDSEARLYSTAYRFYSPDSNRWLTRDPLGMVDGPNVYAYVVNNPVTYSDPLGMFSLGNVMSGIRIGFNILSAASDVWGAVNTFRDPCASNWEKAGSAGLAIAGILLPGERSLGGWDFRVSILNGGGDLIGGAARAAKYGHLWQAASLEKAIARHAGSNYTSWVTASGKRIYENPLTGRQVVYDLNGNYFRIFQPDQIGSRGGVYLDMLGKVPTPARRVSGGAVKNVPLSGEQLQQMTHFLAQ